MCCNVTFADMCCYATFADMCCYVTFAERILLIVICFFVVFHVATAVIIVASVYRYSQKPVIAVNSGGPLESVIDGETGFLCEATPHMFAQAMRILVEQPAVVARMAAAARPHVVRHFSLEAFGAKLDAVLRRMCDTDTADTERINEDADVVAGKTKTKKNK
jgi:glycosyltransferase involved in cell wall biosynthesis